MLLVCLSLLFLFLFFKVPLEALFNNVLVNPILKHVNSTLYNDIGFLFFIFLIFWVPGKSFKKFEEKINVVIFLWTLALFYLFYRFSQNIWELTPLSITDKIYYADLFLVSVLVCSFQTLRKNSETIKLSSDNALFDDSPLRNTGLDYLGYSKYA